MYIDVERIGKNWRWPAYDTELIKVFGECSALSQVLPLCKHKRTAVQAGGACGVWPWLLGEQFDTVLTFEPDPVNFDCLKSNAPDALAYRAALGRASGSVKMVRPASEATNAGAQYVVAGGDIPQMAIDEFCLTDCDFLQLDVEGAEHLALEGARHTIHRCKPVIMIESKVLPHGDFRKEAQQFLKGAGYRMVLSIRNDDVWLPC